jgi:hypothetical protein
VNFPGTFHELSRNYFSIVTQLVVARRKLLKTHPNHGGRHCPMAAMVPSPRHQQQSANMLRDKNMLLRLENIIVFTMYLLAILRHDALLTPRA